MNKALKAQLKTMSDAEKHVVLAAIIEVASEHPFGIRVTESNLAVMFTTAQYEVAEALKRKREKKS